MIYKVLYVKSQGNTCDKCGAGIINEFHLFSPDGKVGVYGSVCIQKMLSLKADITIKKLIIKRIKQIEYFSTVLNNLENKNFKVDNKGFILDFKNDKEKLYLNFDNLLYRFNLRYVTINSLDLTIKDLYFVIDEINKRLKILLNKAGIEL